MELGDSNPLADSALTCENVELPERTCDELEFAMVLIASKGGDDPALTDTAITTAPRRHSGEERPTARSPRAYRQRSKKAELWPKIVG